VLRSQVVDEVVGVLTQILIELEGHLGLGGCLSSAERILRGSNPIVLQNLRSAFNF
jgi:hypothetical protein